MPATMKKIPDETPIAEVVTTQRAQKHLVAAGYVTLGDVRSKGLGSVLGTKYVGDKSLQELRVAIGPQGPVAATPSVEEEVEYEENGMPILLEQVPGGPSHMAWSPARKTDEGVQVPIFVEFDSKGKASVSARMYFMRKFRRNANKVDEAIDEGTDWRNECVALLRRSAHFARGFLILTD